MIECLASTDLSSQCVYNLNILLNRLIMESWHHWDDFLKIISRDHQLTDAETESFLLQFARQNLGQRLEEISAQLPLTENPLANHKKRMSEVYDKFSQNGIELKPKNNKSRPLLKWLETEYSQWLLVQDSDSALSSATTDKSIDWRDICGKVLETQQLRRQATAQQYELNIYVPLGLMERPKTPNPRQNPTGEESQPQKEPELQIVETYKDDAFFQKVIAENNTEKGKHIAIIGEPGAGKTTLLGELAEQLPKNSPDFPICIRLADLRESTIKDYLVNNWLEKALEHIEPVPQSVTPEIIESLKQLFRQGKVWLLLDGVDEMVAESPVQALAKIREQLTDWVGKARVVLTCRLNVWDAAISNTLTDFETYKTLEFEPDDVNEFIRQWFEEASQDEKRRNSGHETFWREQGNRLQQELKEPGKERIRELVRNPLRLSMLCQSWCVPKQDLPETKAALYEQFTTYFFEWKQKEFQEKHRVLKETDKEKIQEALANLALAAMESANRFRIEKKFAIKQMEEEWFNLAGELGWLVLVDRDTRTKKPVYAFYHPTFQEYFAACAIGDWHFFLNHIPDNPKDSKANYRIFDNQWKEVILFWLGREDLRTECKESFIKALVEFQDGCQEYILESKGFYEYRSYFLAALGIAEFKECSCADAILSELIRWGYGDFNLKMQMWVGKRRSISEVARAAFQESDRSRTIPALINVMLNSTTDATNTLLANMVESLGQIGTGNQQAIEALLNVISTTSNLYPLIEGHYLIDKAFNSLGLIGQNNQELIDELNKIMQSSQHEYTCVKAAECLGTIVFGNEQAIARLVDVIEKSAGDFMRSSEAHLSLAKIAPDHPQAGIIHEKRTVFEVARHLFNWLFEEKTTSNDELKRRWAEETLEHIFSKSPKAIKPLIDIIKNSPNEYILLDTIRIFGEFSRNDTEAVSLLIELSRNSQNFVICRWAVGYLAEVNVMHEEVINVLIDILYSDRDIRAHVAYSLGIILKRFPMSSVVSNLKNYMQSQISTDRDFDLYCKLYDILWHCAQNLPYPDFYQAWHQDTLTNSATASLNLANLPQDLADAINDRPDLCNKVKLICIDSYKFGNPENPATKIYNEMRLQGCDKSEDGKPKTMAELQDYWDELRIESEIPLFFLCYDSTALSATPTGFSEPFLKALSKFDRAICVVCEPGDIPLQTFSPQQKDLVANIVQWIEKVITEN
ncbi:HEAT repeat domain-containing protein [Microcoleus sp. EPA2]|uniref:NACHT C-terminal alpha/beta 1 domain-containing protein n=1 Tax=Microcoleus sp. EPA2 TaxID=2841654 RepID=UPI00312B4623